MATSIQRSSLSPQFNTTKADQPLMGALNSKVLPNGIIPVYLQGKLYRITSKQGSVPRIACAISLLNNLENEPKTDLQALKQENRVGFLYVRNGRIQSLTLTPDQMQMMEDNGVNEIVLKAKESVLFIKERMILRKYTSDEEYQTFTHLF